VVQGRLLQLSCSARQHGQSEQLSSPGNLAPVPRAAAESARPDDMGTVLAVGRSLDSECQDPSPASQPALRHQASRMQQFCAYGPVRGAPGQLTSLREKTGSAEQFCSCGSVFSGVYGAERSLFGLRRVFVIVFKELLWVLKWLFRGPAGSPGPVCLFDSGSRCDVAHPDEIVDGRREGEHPSDPSNSAVAGVARPSDGLEPAEDSSMRLRFCWLIT